MKITLKKVFVANDKGKFMAIDYNSGGYPSITDNLGQAIIYDEGDEKGLQDLQSYVTRFSDKSHGGNGSYDTLNGFKVVTATITFEL